MMADSACLIRASATPNDAKLLVHSLAESISFGRFMSEPLGKGWEKWSSFSTHRKYVEEAESYAQPGSVAQKKAFFEAHFKRIAAQRAAQQEAQAAALLLNQQNEETQQSEETTNLLDSHDHDKKEKMSLRKEKEEGVLKTPTHPISKENPDTNLVKDKKKSCSKSLWSAMNAGNNNKDLYPTTTNKGFAATLLTTPRSSGLTTPAQTPQCDDTRKKTVSDLSASGNKTGTKWHKLSSVCSKSFTACRNRLQNNTTLSTPFVLRTEERAAIRKKKLEEKFIACETQKKTTLKVKAGKELRKLSNSFCFKSTTLPPPLLRKENPAPPKGTTTTTRKETKRGDKRLFRDPLLEKNVVQC